MTYEPGAIIIKAISLADLSRLESDLKSLIGFGYGEIVIRVDRGQVTGHKLIVDRNYCIYKNKKDPQ